VIRCLFLIFTLILSFLMIVQPSTGMKRPDPDPEKCKCYADGYESYRSDLALDNAGGAIKNRCYSWGMKAHWEYGWNDRKAGRSRDCPYHEYVQ